MGEGTNAEKCISAVKGKCPYKHSTSDSYGAGERSGKHAKPDAVSAAANEHACSATPITVLSHVAVLAPIHASLSTAVVHSTACPFTHISQSMVVPPLYAPLTATLGLVLLHLFTASVKVQDL